MTAYNFEISPFEVESGAERMARSALGRRATTLLSRCGESDGCGQLQVILSRPDGRWFDIWTAIYANHPEYPCTPTNARLMAVHGLANIMIDIWPGDDACDVMDYRFEIVRSEAGDLSRGVWVSDFTGGESDETTMTRLSAPSIVKLSRELGRLPTPDLSPFNTLQTTLDRLQ